MGAKHLVLGGATAALLVGIVMWGVLERPARVAVNGAFSGSSAEPELTQARGPVAQAARPRLREVVAMQSFVRQRASVYSLVVEADEAALVELLRQAEMEIPVEDADWVVPILYGRYAEIDGPAALRHLRSQPYGFDQRRLAGLFLAWMRLDEDAAIEGLATLPLQEKMQLGATILRLDSRLSDSQREALGRRLGLGRFMNRFSVADRVRLGEDPDGQLDELLAIADRRTRQFGLRSLMAQWSRVDPRAAMAATERVPGIDVRQQTQQQILAIWAQSDPEGALDWALAQPPGIRGQQHWMAAVQSMASQDPRGAMAMVDRLAPNQRSAAVRTVLTTWGAAEPRAASEWLTRVDEPALRAQVVGQIAQSYAHQHPDEALQWVDTLDPAERSRAAIGLANGLADVDPSLAVTALNLIDDPQRRAGAAYNVAMRWARQEPRAAADWVRANIDSEQRPQVLSAAIQQWAQYDTEAALRYADVLEATSDRESSVVAVLPYLQADQARADAYYESLTLPQFRRQAARVLYGYWRNVDSSRAEQYRVAAGVEERASDSAAFMGGMGQAIGTRAFSSPSINLSN